MMSSKKKIRMQRGHFCPRANFKQTLRKREFGVPKSMMHLCSILEGSSNGPFPDRAGTSHMDRKRSKYSSRRICHHEYYFHVWTRLSLMELPGVQQIPHHVSSIRGAIEHGMYQPPQNIIHKHDFQFLPQSNNPVPQLALATLCWLTIVELCCGPCGWAYICCGWVYNCCGGGYIPSCGW